MQIPVLKFQAKTTSFFFATRCKIRIHKIGFFTKPKNSHVSLNFLTAQKTASNN